ncbi:hypothetical protein O3P69_009043 [Scylla paramamosain]|uniref:Uncharacterized protein n=1 Tax=Scylla paramamosain TaxID=85552 RepID=A0AAW0TQY3_SCYPA
MHQCEALPRYQIQTRVRWRLGMPQTTTPESCGSQTQRTLSSQSEEPGDFEFCQFVFAVCQFVLAVCQFVLAVCQFVLAVCQFVLNVCQFVIAVQGSKAPRLLSSKIPIKVPELQVKSPGLLGSKARRLSRHSGTGGEGVHCSLSPSPARRGLRERLRCTGRARRAPPSRPATVGLPPPAGRPAGAGVRPEPAARRGQSRLASLRPRVTAWRSRRIESAPWIVPGTHRLESTAIRGGRPAGVAPARPAR